MQITSNIATLGPSNHAANQMKVSFILHEKVFGDAKLQIIRLNLAVSGKRLRKATGESINARYWDAEKQRVKGKHAQKDSINSYLDTLENRLYDTFREAKGQGVLLTAEELWERVRAKPQERIKNTPGALYERWKSESKNSLSPGRIRAFRSVVDHLESFHPDLTPDKITKGFVSLYFNYLLEEIKDEKGKVVKRAFQNSSLEVHAHWLRIMMEAEGINNSWLKVNLHSKPSKTWLTREELRQVYEYQPTTKQLQVGKDLFLFFCFTGLRYSDVKQLRPIHLSNVGGIPVIRVTQQKTREKVTVALNPMAASIVEKYLNKHTTIFPVPTNSTLNVWIRDLAQAAGIISPVLKVEWRGMERKEIEVPKWEMVTCHTGRHTFTTLTLERVDKRMVSKALGHAGGGSIDAYTHHDENERLQAQLDAWKDLN